MKQFDPSILKQLYIPSPDSHKGANGKLMIIGGSHLFHAASLWALNIASRIVDMVFYSSVPENNEIVAKAKEEFRNGIVVPREHIEAYIEEADCVLIGPGMLRDERGISNFPAAAGSSGSRGKFQISNLDEINTIKNEGEQTRYLTQYLLSKYPHKKWVIDAGALQMMDPEWLRQLNGNVILTPHHGEFERLFNFKFQMSNFKLTNGKIEKNEIVGKMAREHNSIILLKGQKDIVCSPNECVLIEGGNAGMTKGGTGDVLAGLVAALACKNELWLAAQAGAYINKKAGESLAKRVGVNFNASDLVDEIPKVMKEELR